ncbi:hypothetical protein IEQ34_009664 [Dendrobium chrysotoxum]|uniref:Uncharacterized protein n=1 Tax=Dendrobium chrysotoxum TaxID=161865 RepID=A0AAV7GJY2_DENCH|nr:hypothetical protein IEQ34_009664 [Dendrobium chrysotoxum]
MNSLIINIRRFMHLQKLDIRIVPLVGKDSEIIFFWKKRRDTKHVNYKYVTIVVVDMPEGLPLAVTLTSSSSWFSSNQRKQSLQFQSLNEEKQNIQLEHALSMLFRSLEVAEGLSGDLVPLMIGGQVPTNGILILGHFLAFDESNLIGKIPDGSVQFVKGHTSVKDAIDGAVKILTGALAVLWKVVEKVLITKPKGQPSTENKSTTTGVKWSFSPGTNLPMGNIFKMARDSKQKLNEFMKELKTFRSVDLSGHNFGDDGLFFLAESLAFNQSAEDVDFSGNGITAAGLKAFDGVLQANTVLKTLNLSGNAIGDEGAKGILIVFTISENMIIFVFIYLKCMNWESFDFDVLWKF